MFFKGIAVYIYIWKNKTAELQESLTHRITEWVRVQETTVGHLV